MYAQLFLLPVGHEQEAYRHYQRTIEEGFAPRSIRGFINNNDYQKIIKQYPGRRIRAWGARPGEGNERTWSRMDVEDKVLIYKDKMYEYSAVVTFKFRNSKLAEYLWGKSPEGKTWEYMYFLDNLNRISVPRELFNKFFDYRFDYSPRGFMRVSQKTISAMIQEYGSVDGILEQLLRLR